MRRPMLFAAALTALLLFPAAAAAKGPSAATISGPGLSHAITIEGFGEGDSTSPLGILVTETGFFPQAFEQTPSSTTRSRPADRLGPRYDVKYIAWFTADIPVPAGPEVQGQLPGLILALDMNNGRMVYKAVEISTKADLASIKEPVKGKKVTPAEFTEERNKMMDEMQKNNQGGGNRIIIRN